MVKILKQITFVAIVLFLIILISGCFAPQDNNDIKNSFTPEKSASEISENNPKKEVLQKQRWGIYSLNLEDQNVSLIYSEPEEISFLHLNSKGNKFVFSKKIDGEENDSYEVCTLNIDGTGFRRLTENNYWDVYPRWSPNGSVILFLSFRDQNLDIYTMSNQGHRMLATGLEKNCHCHACKYSLKTSHTITSIHEVVYIHQPDDSHDSGC